MYKYYAHINLLDNLIGKGQCPCSGENIVCLEITQEVYDNIERYIYENGELVLNPNYEEEQRQKNEKDLIFYHLQNVKYSLQFTGINKLHPNKSEQC